MNKEKRDITNQLIQYTVIDNLVQKGKFGVCVEDCILLLNKINNYMKDKNFEFSFVSSSTLISFILSKEYINIKDWHYIPSQEQLSTYDLLSIRDNSELWSIYRNLNINFFKTHRQLQNNNYKLTQISEIMKNEIFIKVLSRDFIISAIDKSSKELEWVNWCDENNEYIKTNYHNYDFRKDLPNKPWRNLIKPSNSTDNFAKEE